MSHLDGLRESRKAVIAVTLGWRLFRENETRMTDKGTQGRVVGVEPLGVGPDGKLGFPDRSRISGSSDKTCDNVRMQAAYADSHQMFMDLIGQANRSSTSFYTVDAAGLRTETRPHTADARSKPRSRRATASACRTRRGSIRSATLGESTNGMAIVDTNNFDGGPAPRRRRLQLLLPARLHVDQRQAGREVPQDQGDREAARRAGARPRRLPGAPRRRTPGGELDVERRASWRGRARTRPTRS